VAICVLSEPQKLLSQSRFIHPDLNALFVELFNADVYGHLRRAQGFVRTCTKEINTAGHETASHDGSFSRYDVLGSLHICDQSMIGRRSNHHEGPQTSLRLESPAALPAVRFPMTLALEQCNAVRTIFRHWKDHAA
jgi:hypothetical protein